MRGAAPPPMLFFEEFHPTGASVFDGEHDQIVGRAAVERGYLTGFDNVAGKPSLFHVRSDNFREDLFAQTSESTARHRTVVCGLSLALFGHPFATLPEIASELRLMHRSLYLTERNTPLFDHLHAQLPEELFTFSEYFGDDHRPGALVDGVRHEDLMATSFHDAQFDVVVTSEVLEHVPDATRAEREIVRILKPGGTYVFTVPLDPLGAEDTILAERRGDGSVLFHGPPVYHGDPYRPEGILAYRIFSILGMERRFAALGCALQTYRFWSKRYGILGGDSWIHLVRKPGPEGGPGD